MEFGLMERENIGLMNSYILNWTNDHQLPLLNYIFVEDNNIKLN